MPKPHVEPGAPTAALTSVHPAVPGAPTSPGPRALSAAAFTSLADVPPEAEWFANLGNAATRRAYQNALSDFMHFVGMARAEEFRLITRAHVIAWRDELRARALSATTVRHRLAALSSLFEYLCERNAVTHNPVRGVKRPSVDTYEGKTPALSDTQAAALLQAPTSADLKGLRDRAMLATLLYQGLRREELCRLKVKDWRQDRRGVLHMKVSGKGGKTRYVPLHPQVEQLIAAYLQAAGHGAQSCGALFRSLQRARVAGNINGNTSGDAQDAARGETHDEAAAPTGRVPGISADGVYKIVKALSTKLGFGVGAHALRATAATNALDNQADLAWVQEWLGHAHIATTRLYDHRQNRSSESPTFKIAYPRPQPEGASASGAPLP